MHLVSKINIKLAKDYTIYLDIDGVIADFKQALKNNDLSEENINWDYITSLKERFWAEIPLKNDAQELLDFLKNKHTIILSAHPRNPEYAIKGKKLWLKKYAPHLEKSALIVKKYQKSLFASPNSILIDDDPTNIARFRSKGGIGILHQNTRDTLQELTKILEGTNH